MDTLTVDPDDQEDAYCDALDCNGPVYVGSIAFDPSYILKELDPTAYRCGLVDYANGIDVEDTVEHQELAKKIEELETELEESQISLKIINFIKGSERGIIKGPM